MHICTYSCTCRHHTNFLTHKFSLSLPLIHTHTHTHTKSLSLSYTQIFSLTHTQTLSYTQILSLTHTQTLSYTQILSLTHTQTHTHKFSLSHTHKLSHIHTHKTQQQALTCIVYKLVRLLSVQRQGFDVPPMVLQDRVLKCLTGELELELLDHLFGRFNLLLRRCGGQHGSKRQESQLQANWLNGLLSTHKPTGTADSTSPQNCYSLPSDIRCENPRCLQMKSKVKSYLFTIHSTEEQSQYFFKTDLPAVGVCVRVCCISTVIM